jgi:hypothetical protein
MKPAFAANPQAWIHRAAPSPQDPDSLYHGAWETNLPSSRQLPTSRRAKPSAPQFAAPAERPSVQPSRFRLVMTVSAALLAVLGLGLSVGAWVAKAMLGAG